MLPFLLAGALLAAQPSTCPTDLLVTNPRIKVIRARNRTLDNNVVEVDVKNNGTAAQRPDVRQHLDLMLGNTVVGTQPIPALGPEDSYEAAFRFQLKHEKKRKPQVMTFRFVIDSKPAPGENCTTANDKLTATL